MKLRVASYRKSKSVSYEIHSILSHRIVKFRRWCACRMAYFLSILGGDASAIAPAMTMEVADAIPQMMSICIIGFLFFG